MPGSLLVPGSLLERVRSVERDGSKAIPVVQGKLSELNEPADAVVAFEMQHGVDRAHGLPRNRGRAQPGERAKRFDAGRDIGE